jgi:uncharacterized protein YjbI with pentapeptide repeats
MVGANLSGSNMYQVDLDGAVITQADLSGVKATRAQMAGMWGSLSKLVGAELGGANLSGDVLFGADLTGANLSSSRLNGAMLVGANLSGADLRGADLSGAALVLPLPPGASVDFDYNQLTGEKLLVAMGNTVLSKALFDPVIFDLPESRLLPLLKDAVLQGVLYNDQTIWPLGFDIPDSAIFSEQ